MFRVGLDILNVAIDWDADWDMWCPPLHGLTLPCCSSLIFTYKQCSIVSSLLSVPQVCLLSAACEHLHKLSTPWGTPSVSLPSSIWLTPLQTQDQLTYHISLGMGRRRSGQKTISQVWQWCPRAPKAGIWSQPGKFNRVYEDPFILPSL